MQVKNKPKLLKELANSVDTPWEFIEALASLQNLRISEVAAKAGISIRHYYVTKNQKSMGIKVAIKISNAFEIDPSILNRVLADFKLKKILKDE